MKIAILGYGDQGEAAYDYWNKPENQITICDINPQLAAPDGTSTRLGPDYLKDLRDFDLLVRSPSIHPNDIVESNPDTPDILGKITTVTDEFFKVCPTKNIIGVTGTKGKGTTSTLIARMLQEVGHQIHLGGNIGIPPLTLLEHNIRPEDWVVLELANFQLIDLKHSPHIAVCLMVVPEHMDWHKDMDEYVAAKQQLFAHQTEEDVAIYFAESDISKEIVKASPGTKIPYYASPGAVIEDNAVKVGSHEICKVDEIKLLGRHNWQNVCAAVTAVWQVHQDIEAIRSIITTFSGLEHRLEFVREATGVKYYDDSFGTTPETAIVAIQAFSEPKVLILGGSDKGTSYDKLAQVVSNNNVRSVIIIGHTGPVIKNALQAEGYQNVIEGGNTMGQIVKTACAHAEAGDVVLLSTACASFDLFKDYKDRGEQFQKVVKTLA
jgi:UDP-N-acetylmuramoylalanine--D-glutamate ligase